MEPLRPRRRVRWVTLRVAPRRRGPVVGLVAPVVAPVDARARVVALVARRFRVAPLVAPRVATVHLVAPGPAAKKRRVVRRRAARRGVVARRAVAVAARVTGLVALERARVVVVATHLAPIRLCVTSVVVRGRRAAVGDGRAVRALRAVRPATAEASRGAGAGRVRARRVGEEAAGQGPEEAEEAPLVAEAPAARRSKGDAVHEDVDRHLQAVEPVPPPSFLFDAE